MNMFHPYFGFQNISNQSLPSILIPQNCLFWCFHHIFDLKKHEDLETLPIFWKKLVFNAKDLHVQGHAVNSSQMLHLYFWYPRSYTKLQGGSRSFFSRMIPMIFRRKYHEYWITSLSSNQEGQHVHNVSQDNQKYLKYVLCFYGSWRETTEMSEVCLQLPVFMMLQFWRKNKQLPWWWPPNRIYTRVWCGMFASNLKRSMCRIYGFYLKWYERI